MNKPKQILFLFIFFIAAGLLVVFLTHPEETTTINANLVSADGYVEHIRPWLVDVNPSRSVNNISNIKQKFVDFRGADKSMGPAHISLFLAFDSWEKFYYSDLDEIYKQRAIEHFSRAAEFLPELKPDIDNLISMLNNDGYY